MFQQNFSLKEFKKFLFDTIETLQTLDDDKIIPYIESQLTTLIKTDFLYLLSLENSNTYTIHTLNKTIIPDLSHKHLFSEVILKKQPLLLKDLKNSLLYDKKQDNIIDEEIEELLLVPVKMPNTTNNEYPNFLVWAGLKHNSEYSFSQKQTLYLIKFLEGVKSHFSNVAHSHKMTIEQCLDNTETLERMIARNKQYFHSIIHDVRTPMNALIGFLDLLAMNETDTTKKDYLDSALKSGKHMVMLINDALDIAKIESGELPIEKKPFDLHDALADTVKIFYETARKKGILLCAYIDPLIPHEIVSDPYRIKQVLSNLLSNAIKFTPEHGSVLIEATYDKDRDIVTISVKDTGIGIKKEALNDIFVAYRQESASTEKEYGGTGLGLNISYQIVSMLGGRLEVESIEGEGSRFYFELPSLSPEKNQSFIEIDKTSSKLIRLYRWKHRYDIQSHTILRYFESLQSHIKIEEKSTSLKSIYRNGDYNADDIFVIEHDVIYEDDYEFAQLLLDKGCQIIWIEDVFDITFNYFKGDIHKLSYPILTKNVYKVLLSQHTKQTNSNKKVEFAKEFKGKKILVVDDNRINLKFMDALISKMGIKVVVTDNAPNALDEIRKDRFDMLIIDENMPKMLGSEAIAIIRKEIANSTIEDLAIVSLSGDSHNQERIKKAGANEVLTKPVVIDKLNEVLEKYLL